MVEAQAVVDGVEQFDKQRYRQLLNEKSLVQDALAVTQQAFIRYALDSSSMTESVVQAYRDEHQHAKKRLDEIEAELKTFAFSSDDADVNEAELDEGEEDEPENENLTFPDVAWRGIFQTYREAMVNTTEASDVHHFATFWTAAAVRLRRRVFFQYGLDLYPNVFLIAFGESGDKKTTAARRSLELVSEQAKVLSGIGSGEGIAEWLSEEASTLSHYLFLEELSELLTRAHWDGATIISFLTNIFDCPRSYAQKFKKTPVSLTEPTVSLLACTTQSLFWQHNRDIDFHSGFANRFLYFTGAVKDPIPLPCRPDFHKLTAVHTALARLDTLTPCEVKLTPEAAQMWGKFYRVWRTTDRETLLKAATERVPAYCLKLSMTYAALEQTLPEITGPQLKAAIAVGHYSTKCLEMLLKARTTATRQGTCEQAILRVLEDANKALPAWRIHHRTGGRFTAEEINRALLALERLGHVANTGETTKYGKPLFSLSRSRSRAKPFSQQ